jgi:hypothetical protein
MKMKPGPKAILNLLCAAVFVGAGFWAGRGFPKTWDGVFHSQTIASAKSSVVDPRVEILVDRVTALEQEVATLKEEIRASHQYPPPVSQPLDEGSVPAGPAADDSAPPTDGPSQAKIDAHMEFR